ncbi:hypothetical protein BDN72DRAFT_621370 [Pluteus cervinus]|uniref:Uncharacterized protein n=1 Tax=Pluteus cervinus TaxID=181527 RepID=A0ACD3ATD9_9AGAR|nr:hypothetical protein BDN72DRAFT_621370 [Pluteus cervinus]
MMTPGCLMMGSNELRLIGLSASRCCLVDEMAGSLRFFEDFLLPSLLQELDSLPSIRPRPKLLYPDDPTKWRPDHDPYQAPHSSLLRPCFPFVHQTKMNDKEISGLACSPSKLAASIWETNNEAYQLSPSSEADRVLCELVLCLPDSEFVRKSCSIERVWLHTAPPRTTTHQSPRMVVSNGGVFLGGGPTWWYVRSKINFGLFQIALFLHAEGSEDWPVFVRQTDRTAPSFGQVFGDF